MVVYDKYYVKKKIKTPIREKGKKYLLLVRKKETDNKKLVE